VEKVGLEKLAQLVEKVQLVGKQVKMLQLPQALHLEVRLASAKEEASWAFGLIHPQVAAQRVEEAVEQANT